MNTYALTGKSGTGKSTNAIRFAFEHGINTIIDDGLLIHHGKRIAGSSAKFEKTMIAAVKRAIFTDDSHAQEVKEAIEGLAIDSILIIGTSVRMVERIAGRLQISPIDHYYRIEDILPEETIQLAQHERETKGKHTIPLSYKELDQNLFQRFIQKSIDIFSSQKEKIGETTIVLPYFHQRLLAKLRPKKKQAQVYRTKRRIIYNPPTKEQLANLLPYMINYLKEKIQQLKLLLIHYYGRAKQGFYELIAASLHQIHHLLNHLIEQYEAFQSAKEAKPILIG